MLKDTGAFIIKLDTCPATQRRPQLASLDVDEAHYTEMRNKAGPAVTFRAERQYR